MVTTGIIITKESIIEKTYCCENLPQPLFAKEGKFLPLVKGGEEGFGLQCLYNYGLISIKKQIGESGMAEIRILKKGLCKRIVLPPRFLKSLEGYIMSFISKAIKYFLGERKERKLAAEYRQASLEIKRASAALRF